jgi:hypothetical protein
MSHTGGQQYSDTSPLVFPSERNKRLPVSLFFISLNGIDVGENNKKNLHCY